MGQLASVGRVVHYVARGSADGRFPAVCRAATITETGADPFTVGLAITNPTGVFFHPLPEGVTHHPGAPGDSAAGARCNLGHRVYPGGTWHWPEVTG